MQYSTFLDLVRLWNSLWPWPSRRGLSVAHEDVWYRWHLHGPGSSARHFMLRLELHPGRTITCAEQVTRASRDLHMRSHPGPAPSQPHLFHPIKRHKPIHAVRLRSHECELKCRASVLAVKCSTQLNVHSLVTAVYDG